MAAENVLAEPASPQFIRWLHSEFYRDAPQEMLRVRSDKREFVMEPGAWRSRTEHDVAVGNRSAKLRASWPFLPHIIGLTIFIPFLTAMVASAGY